MISTDEGDTVWIAHFEAEKQEERLKGIESAIDKIAHEEVVGIGDIASDSEEFHQIVKLAMDITTNRDWRIYTDDISFFYEEFSRLVAELTDLGFGY